MFEAERVLMSDNVIIPVYSFVTKRLVNAHLQGWHNNVLDHHQTRFMFKLRSVDPEDDVVAPVVEAAAQQGLTALEELPGETATDSSTGPAIIELEALHDETVPGQAAGQEAEEAIDESLIQGEEGEGR
jgi:hypothetical protein